ncbi:HAD family hydrolase [Haloferula chungangensis]|uniref:HAD family hydrolase n=1 Tax=Haloferula chungangensis TaxID=1048331 RepID=A0ABW2L953_9BACT
MHYLLDLDGTLTDPKVGILTSLQHALRELGEPVPEIDELAWCIGPPLKDALVTIFGSDEDPRVAQGVTHFRARFGDVGLFENEVYEGIPEALAELVEQGHQLHIATSKPEVFARRILDHFNLAEPFTSIHGSELDGTRSDKGELIQHILRTQGIAAEDAVMVGDRKHDVLGAIRNQVRGMGVLWGFGSRDELEAAGACHLFEKPSDLAVPFS